MPHFLFFFSGDLNLGPLTLTFELGRDFCILHVSSEFPHPTFCRSEVIVLTNKLTNKQTPLKTSTSLRYTTPVGNNARLFTWSTIVKAIDIMSYHLFVTFCVSRIRRETYISHARLCVSMCLSVRGRMPTLLHGPGYNLEEW